jgi:hypothetical protein
MSWRKWAAGGALVTVVFGGGCVTEEKTAPRQQPIPVEQRLEKMGVKPVPESVEKALLTDPCVERMHNLCGAMLAFYLINKDLPASLDDLKTVAEFGGPLEPSCPASGQPFVYEPAGLHSVNGRKYIVLYDATPAHKGTGLLAAAGEGVRHAIVTPENNPGSSRSFEVVSMPEGLFRTYQARAVP